MLTNSYVVLAIIDDIFLLWRILSRPPLSHILLTAILTTPRRIIWQISGSLLVALALRNGQPDRLVAARVAALPWPPSLFDACIHLVQAQP